MVLQNLEGKKDKTSQAAAQSTPQAGVFHGVFKIRFNLKYFLKGREVYFHSLEQMLKGI